MNMARLEGDHVLKSAATIIHELSHYQGTHDFLYVDMGFAGVGVDTPIDEASNALMALSSNLNSIANGARDGDIFKGLVRIREKRLNSSFKLVHPELMGNGKSVSYPGIRQKILRMNADSVAMLAMSLSAGKLSHGLR